MLAFDAVASTMQERKVIEFVVALSAFDGIVGVDVVDA